MSNPSSLSYCQVVPPLSNSDHLGIKTETRIRGTSRTVQPPRHTVWHYSYADWGKACEKIEVSDWDSMLTEDINLSWDRWYSKFISIMEECIPKKVLPSRRNLPLLNIRSAIRRRNTIFKRLATVLNSDLLAIESLACFAELKPSISKT